MPPRSRPGLPSHAVLIWSLIARDSLHGAIYLPMKQGRMAMTDVRDIVDVAAHVLLCPAGALEIAPGVRHDIPSVSDCKACHEGNGRDVVIGFSALQLSADRDPLAPHAEPVPAGSLQLFELLRENRLAYAPTAWQRTPPVVAAGTPRGRAALGYLHGNCSFCHNHRDPVSSVGLSLRVDLMATSADEQPGMRSAVGIPSKFQIRSRRAVERPVGQPQRDSTWQGD